MVPRLVVLAITLTLVAMAAIPGAEARVAAFPTSPFQGKGFTLSLPRGWTPGSLGNTTAFFSADHTAEVLVLESPTTHHLSDQELKQVIAFAVPQANATIKQQLTPTYRPFAIGPMTGLAAAARIGRSSAGYTVAAVSDATHSVLVVELIFPPARKQQAHEAQVLVASIHATG
jgi:hypothetical protein